MNITRLSKKEQWADRWAAAGSSELAFDPSQPIFRDLHRQIQRHVGDAFGGRFLEVGAYPGKYLWYFHTYCNLEPWGIEYVETAARQAQALLDSSGVPAQMIVEDFFDLKVDEYLDESGFDVVGSFGFVEHFDEPEDVVSRHLDVTRDGGLVVVSVPNHHGWNGNILKAIDSEKWRQHNGMSLHDLVRAFDKAGANDILYSGYAGHIGFWNTALYRTAKNRLGRLYPLIRTPLWAVEKLGQWIVPNNPMSSPDILVIARKTAG